MARKGRPMHSKSSSPATFPRLASLVLVCILAVAGMMRPPFAQAEEAAKAAPFVIMAYELEGNTIFDEPDLLQVLLPFIGSDKTVADVEAARDGLEKFYHDQGYPTVLVNIPEQTVDNGVIRLGIVESRIRKVRVVGNEHYTQEMIMGQLPSLEPGEILYLPKVQKELAAVNSNPDLKVTPVMAPGKDPGTIDMELQVKDRLPMHGNLELNNRYAHDTTELRANGSLHYDNLWQLQHSLALQVQFSPQDTSEVRVLAGSYAMPSPLHEDHKLILYAIKSDSETAFGEDFLVKGKGAIYGLRYFVPLPAYQAYSQNIIMGVDYKDFDESLGYASTSDNPIKTPISYLPLSFSYNSQLKHASGYTGFNLALNMALRNLVTDQRQFEVKRFRARGDYQYLTLGVEHSRKLPYDFGLLVKLDGQLASEPLIANEQFSAGGMESVRGYMESEDSGDNAIHATAELATRQFDLNVDFWPRLLALTPYGFADYAELWTKESLPNEDSDRRLASVGLGVRGRAGSFTYRCDWGCPLVDTPRIEHGDYRFHFKMAYEF